MLGDRWFIGSIVVCWGWVPVLMVADWGGFIINLGFFFLLLIIVVVWVAIAMI